MASLYVRNVPEALYNALRARAKQEGRSISAETIAILRRTLTAGPRGDLVTDLRQVRSQVRWPDNGPGPEELIREARDAR